jgi:hypothetical protein
MKIAHADGASTGWRRDAEAVEAAGAVDAQTAPTAPWKTTERFSTSFHSQACLSLDGDISNELRTGTLLTSLDRSAAKP